MNGDRVRAALAGAGFWGSRAHLPALLAQPEVDVVGVIDPDLARARHLAASGSIPHAYATLGEMIDLQPLDLVVIAAPTEEHAPLATAALQSGIAVLCEKPLANTIDVAVRLAELSARTAVPSTVGYSFRYSPPLQALKRDIVSGSLGTPWLLEMFEYNAQFHPSRGKPTGWKGDPAQARAGALLEYGSHLIDMAEWLAGSIEGVHGSFARVLPDARLDDIATLQIAFHAPAIGILVSGWVLSGSIPGIKIRFHGSEGLAEVELNQTLPGGQAYRRSNLDGEMREMSLEPVGDAVSNNATRHVADIIARLRGGESPYPGTMPSFGDGVRVQRVIEAALTANGDTGSRLSRGRQSNLQ